MQIDLYMTPEGEVALWERACRKQGDQTYSRVLCGPMGERLRPIESDKPSDSGCGVTNLVRVRKGSYIIEAFQNKTGRPRLMAYRIRTIDWNRVQALVDPVAKYSQDTWEIPPPKELIEACAVALQKLHDIHQEYVDRRKDPARRNRTGDYLWAS